MLKAYSEFPGFILFSMISIKIRIFQDFPRFSRCTDIIPGFPDWDPEGYINTYLQVPVSKVTEPEGFLALVDRQHGLDSVDERL